ncbi:MAG TPA: GH25 family lysozyme [Myxococcota bacterium]|nr:GH25 family lysozyme [Myxococcota bacterium]
MTRMGVVSAIAAVLGAAAYATYQAGLWRPNALPRGAAWGVDVSRHQGDIDWRSVRGAGASFAFIKASEGQDWRDPLFEENWRGAREACVLRGAYHFFTFCSAGAQQARNFLAAVEETGELPPAVDVEHTGNCSARPSAKTIRRELGVFLAEVEAATGRQPILYFTERAYRELLAGQFPRHALWPRSILGEPRARGRRPWRFWQLADNARVPGIRGPVDLDVFRGSEAELELAR